MQPVLDCLTLAQTREQRIYQAYGRRNARKSKLPAHNRLNTIVKMATMRRLLLLPLLTRPFMRRS